MSWLASNLITWRAPRSNIIAPSSHGIIRPLNSMIGVPVLIGNAANNPTPLIGDRRFCHSFCRCGLIFSPRSSVGRILLFCKWRSILRVSKVLLRAKITSQDSNRPEQARCGNRGPVTRRRFTTWKLTPSPAGADQTLCVPTAQDSSCRYENAVKHKDIRFLSLFRP